MSARKESEAIDKRNAAVMALHAERDRLAAVNAELRAALETIAGGMTSNFAGAPDPMANWVAPEYFRAAMWTWSQAVARTALAAAKSQEK